MPRSTTSSLTDHTDHTGHVRGLRRRQRGRHRKPAKGRRAMLGAGLAVAVALGLGFASPGLGSGSGPDGSASDGSVSDGSVSDVESHRAALARVDAPAPPGPAGEAPRDVADPTTGRDAPRVRAEGASRRSPDRVTRHEGRGGHGVNHRTPHHRPASKSQQEPEPKKPEQQESVLELPEGTPLAPRNAQQVVAAASQSTSYEPGYCLQWVRTQAGVPSLYSDAATAWAEADARHPDDETPPAGAAVYWTGGSQGYGHIAISLGNGLVRSTDVPAAGSVGTVPVSYFEEHWDLTYAGWSPTVNGRAIPGIPTDV